MPKIWVQWSLAHQQFVINLFGGNGRMKELGQSAKKTGGIIETCARQRGLPFAIAIVDAAGTVLDARFAPPSAEHLLAEATEKARFAVQEDCDTIFRREPLHGGLVIRQAHRVIGGIGVAGLDEEDQHLAVLGRRYFSG